MKRPDQIARLEALHEQMIEVVLLDADPAGWPAFGKQPMDMTQQERGDAYWCRKLAAASISLAERLASLLTDAAELDPNGKPHVRPELEAEIAQAERRAAKAVDQALAKARQLSSGPARG